MASKRRNMSYENNKQETTEIEWTLLHEEITRPTSFKSERAGLRDGLRETERIPGDRDVAPVAELCGGGRATCFRLWWGGPTSVRAEPSSTPHITSLRRIFLAPRNRGCAFKGSTAPSSSPRRTFFLFDGSSCAQLSSPIRMSDHASSCGSNNTQSIADYLAQLLKDRKQVIAFPNVFMHVERLIDEGHKITKGWQIARIRLLLLVLVEHVSAFGRHLQPERRYMFHKNKEQGPFVREKSDRLD
ncbi:hypothetical protein AAG570_005954 [Ranatra chinensis]|uniref:STAR protein homodimerisation region domain-containing protein n=1 Tax=Ranatra chinensis TaxID=642074 RepID=A0ABD0YID8_9HEMI